MAKSPLCFMRIIPKLLFFFPPTPRVSRSPISWDFQNPGRTSPETLFFSFTIPTPRGSLPNSSFPDLSERNVEDTRTRARACTHPNKHAHPGHRDCAPDFGLTYLRKYLWPVAVKVISQPGGSGSSSVTSYDCWRRCACCCAGLPAAPAPVPSCRDAGDE